MLQFLSVQPAVVRHDWTDVVRFTRQRYASSVLARFLGHINVNLQHQICSILVYV